MKIAVKLKKEARHKFLIIITDQNVQNRQGGVYNFYMNLKPLLKVNHEYHSLNNDGIPINNKIATTLIHFVRLYSKLKTGNYDCLVLNTSLNINAVLRDSIFAVIANSRIARLQRSAMPGRSGAGCSTGSDAAPRPGVVRINQRPVQMTPVDVASERRCWTSAR